MAGDKQNVSQRVLTYAQVCQLQQVVGNELRINARGPNPTLTMTARELVEAVRDSLNRAGIPVDDIRINGSAASCVVACDAEHTYNDLDVLFNLSQTPAVNRNDHTRHDRIRSAALTALLDFFPDNAVRNFPTGEVLSEAYVHKMVRIDNGMDRWSLISLQNHSGRNIELKFVDSMRRKYQFSIDSFQVVIDSFLLYREASPIEMNERFFPTVMAQTFYGNFDAALEHLEQKLIATNNPEEIRGGGLLKYCSLLAYGYKSANGVNTEMLEKLMCARFFIDFQTIELQRVQLENYLVNHFAGQDVQKGFFLVLALNVIQRSAYCLPGHERTQTLNMIHTMALAVTFAPEFRAYSKQREMNSFDGNVECLRSAAPRCTTSPLSCLLPRLPSNVQFTTGPFMNKMYTPLIAYPVYYSSPVIIPNTNCGAYV